MEEIHDGERWKKSLEGEMEEILGVKMEEILGGIYEGNT